MASPARGQASSPLRAQKPDDVPDLWFGAVVRKLRCLSCSSETCRKPVGNLNDF